MNHVGTHGYKAPEIILKQPTDFKCDIWSLGCLLYELLCGQMPFLGSDIEEIEQHILYRNLNFEGPIWASVSEASIDLITKMLRRDQ